MHSFPKMFRLRQRFHRPRVADLAGAVQGEFARCQVAQRFHAGQRVALAVGSRGIANLATLVRATVDQCKQLGVKPFIIPAMGSHGGATAEGQRGVLADYGITPAAMGCPIESQMETEIVCQSPEGFPVHFDRLALQADHVIVINRVKPHTRFVGPVESGLMKMLLIGLGKHNGAKVYHQAIQTLSFPQIVGSVADQVLRRCPVRFGLAIIENAYDETAHVELVPAERFATREPELLQMAKGWLPSLPFDQADLLIVDYIGKNISGSGMDTNVIGRKFNDRQAIGSERPVIHHIYVRRLTEATHGNACGIGIAEFCHDRVVKGMDKEKTWVNAVTAGHVASAMIPLHWDSDLAVLNVARTQCGLTPIADAKWMWIPDTLHLEEVMCSEIFYESAKRLPNASVLTEPAPLAFDSCGELEEAFSPTQ